MSSDKLTCIANCIYDEGYIFYFLSNLSLFVNFNKGTCSNIMNPENKMCIKT